MPTRSSGPASCSSPSRPCRSRRWTCSARRARRTSGPRRCPTCPVCRPSGSCASGRPTSSGDACGSRPPPGWPPATAGWPSSRWRAPRRPWCWTPTCPTPSWRPWACRRSPAGSRWRAGPRCVRASACSCWGLGASSARSPCRRRACSGPAGSSQPLARPPRESAPRPAAPMPSSTCGPTRTPPPWASGCGRRAEGRSTSWSTRSPASPGRPPCRCSATAGAWSTSAAPPGRRCPSTRPPCAAGRRPCSATRTTRSPMPAVARCSPPSSPTPPPDASG